IRRDSPDHAARSTHRGLFSVQRRPTLTSTARQSTRVLHLDTCGSLPIRDSHLCLQAFNAVRLLQLVVPTSTRFTAPLLAQPDLSREKSLASRSSLRFTAHVAHHIDYGKYDS